MVGNISARDATSGDNDALVALSVACPMEGDIGLAVDRAPDFFALNRLEGDQWRVGVVDGPDGCPIGCIAIAERTVHINGEPTPAMYVSDLKVHPAHRGQGVAESLIEWARTASIEISGEEILTFFTVLAGNRAMERHMAGPRGLSHVRRVATIRTHSVSLLWRRRRLRAGLSVQPAESSDLEEMADLWMRLAPAHQFSQIYSASSLMSWIEAAPELDLSNYLVARSADGRLAGFMGLWDQSSFKRLRVTGYSRRLAAVRAGFNSLAPVVGAPRLPPPGGALQNLTAIHICVPPAEPKVLRTLVIDAYNRWRRRGYSFLNLGLDVTNPLSGGLSGLFAQGTDIWLCVASLSGRIGAVDLEDRIVHHEIALV